MSKDTDKGKVFLTASETGGSEIRHLEKHRGIAMDFWYLETETGRKFDVRDFTESILGDAVQREDLLVAQDGREAHKKAILHVVSTAGLDWRERAQDCEETALRSRHRAESAL